MCVSNDTDVMYYFINSKTSTLDSYPISLLTGNDDKGHVMTKCLPRYAHGVRVAIGGIITKSQTNSYKTYRSALV